MGQFGNRICHLQSLQELQGCRSCALGDLPETRDQELWRQHREQGPRNPCRALLCPWAAALCEPQLSLCWTKLAFSACPAGNATLEILTHRDTGALPPAPGTGSPPGSPQTRVASKAQGMSCPHPAAPHADFHSFPPMWKRSLELGTQPG